MASYRNYPANIPYFVDQFTNSGRVNTYGDMFDRLYADALAGAKNGLVSISDPSALNAHGANYDLPVNKTESDIVYRSRLKQAFEIWKKAGTDEGVTLALQWLGITNPNIVHWQDLVDRGVPSAFGGGYHTIAGADANGGLRFLNIGDLLVKVSITVATNSRLFVNVSLDINAPRTYTINISLHGSPAGAVLSTANDVVTALREASIEQQLGVIFDATGTGAGLAGVGTATLSNPIYTHFFVEIDQDNLYGPPQKWNDVAENKAFQAISSPTGTNLVGMAGSSTKNIVAVGSNTLTYFDGENWLSDNPAVAANYTCVVSDGGQGFFIASDVGDFLYRSMVATYNNFNAPWGAIAINAMWASGPTDIWAVTANGKALHYTGAAFTTANTAAASAIYGIWGTSNTNIWTVGANGIIQNFDGANWTSVASPVATDLYAIHGISANLIFAVGKDGAILKYDGTSWALSPNLPTNSDLYAVYCNNLNLVTACGKSGAMVFYNGQIWNALNSGSNVDLRGVYSPLDDDLWACGSSGTLLRRVAARFTEMSVPKVGPLSTLWVTSDTDIWAGGSQGRLAHYDGASWSFAISPLVPTSINDVSLISATKTGYICGSGGKIWKYNFGGDPLFNVMDSGTTSSLYGITALTDSNVWAVGANGAILHFDGTQWAGVASPTSKTLYDIYALRPNAIYAVGAGGTVIFYDGATWQNQTTNVNNDLFGVVAFNNRSIAVGTNGTALVNDGAGWVSTATGTTADLYGVSAPKNGEYYACGSAGTIIKLSGNVWASQTTGLTKSLYKITVEPLIGILIAVGAGGQATTLTAPNTWFTQTTGTTEDITGFGLALWDNIVQGFAGTSVGNTLTYNNTWAASTGIGKAVSVQKFWGANSTDIWAACNSLTLLHYDGISWAAVIIGATGSTQYARMLWGFSATDVWAIGQAGFISRYDGISWAQQPTPTAQTLYSMWGISNGDFWIGGAAGVLYHYDGTNYTVVAGIPNTYDIFSIFGFTSQNIYACGFDSATSASFLLHYNGTAWSTITIPSSLKNVNFAKIWGNDLANFWIVGANNTVISYDGSVFKSYALDKYYGVADLKTTATNVFFVATGKDGFARIEKLIPDRFSNTWNGGGTWNFTELVDGITNDIRSGIRKFKASGTSCRFFRVKLGDKWETIPVGELAEIDGEGNYITKEFLFDF